MQKRPIALLPALALVLAGCGELADESGDGALEGPIEFVVPYAAGGGTDNTARQLATAAEETCGVDSIITNQEGSGGGTGFQSVADAEPDGTTVGVVSVELAMLEHQDIATVSPDDLTGLIQYNFDPAAFTVSASSDYESIHDVVEAADGGETITVGTSGAGSIWEVSAAGLADAQDIELNYAPFDGAAPAITAVLGDQVDATSASGAEVLAQVESEELEALAVMGDERLDALPDTPTLAEEGIDWVSGTWRGMAVPNGTPDEIVDELESCLTEAAEDETFTSFMDENAFGEEYRDSAEFNEFMDAEYERYEQLIDELANG